MIDVIIIGAGPAGLIAANEIAKSGKQAVLLEKKRNLDTLDRACSQQLILDSDYEGEGIRVDTGKFVFDNSGFSVPYSGELIPVYHKFYHSPKNHIIHFARENGKVPFSYKFDKQKLLKDMADICVKNGVEIRYGTIAASAADNGQDVSVNIVHSGTTETITAKKLIVAEGVNANVCESLGMNAERKYMATALSVKYIYRNIKGIEPYTWHLYYGKAYHSNAAVIIGPSLYGKDTFDITVTGNKNNRPAVILGKFIEDSPMSENLKDIELVKAIGCSVKAYTSMKSPCKGNVIAIGDAAGMIEVEVQGGLLCGYHAAKAVLQELNGENGWASYTEWWNNSFEFNSADYLKVAQGYALVPTYTDDELDYLFALTEQHCLYGTYSQYKTPKIMWDCIRQYDDLIKMERPSLFEKIQNLDMMSISDSFKD